jgi:sirohydrochlorin ferrochelatase
MQQNLGIIIVDHGSRNSQSNAMLEETVRQFARKFQDTYAIVEPAHMDLAQPTIATAYRNCVQRGARHLVVCPYFLSPGKHWTQDIPRLLAEAARQFPQTTWRVADTLGVDDLMLELLQKRVRQALRA